MGVSKNSLSRVVGVDVTPKNFNLGSAQMLPQRLAIIGQGNDDATYDERKYECEADASEVAKRFGYGSPLHLAARQLFPQNGSVATFPVTIYPVKKAAASAAATGTITVTGTATKAGSGKIHIGGIAADFVVTKGQTGAELMPEIIAAINSVLEMPVTAGTVDNGSIPLTAKWSGAIGNDITVIAEYEADGIAIAVTEKLTSGAGRASVTNALSQINNVWETFLLNTLGYTDSALLDEYMEFGLGRWGVLNKKPCLVATGCTDDYATRTAVTDTRKNDYINFLIQSTASPELPFVIAAKGLINDIITTADSNPAMGYKGLLTSLKTGEDAEQENYTVRNMAMQKGASTNVINGSVAELNDIVTMYHPDSEGKYPYRRYVCDLVKLMNVVYNVRLIMESDEKKAAPLVPDEQVTTNKTAIQPKMVKGELAILAEELGKAAILSDPKFTKKNLEVKIDSENPKRINSTFPCKLSGNIEVSSTDVYFGFYLGEQ